MNSRYFKTAAFTTLLALSAFYFSNFIFAFSGDDAAPGNTEKLLREIQRTGWEGKHGRAIEAYMKLLKDEPQNIDAMIGLAQNYEWAKKFEKAKTVYSDILKISPQNITAAIGLAKVCFFKGELTVAAKNFKDIVDNNPGNIEVHLAFAQYLGWRQKYSDSRKIYKTVLAKEPQNIEAKMGLGQLAVWQEKFEEAIIIYRSVMAIPGADVFAARMELARAYFLKGDIKRAKLLYMKLAGEKPGNRELAKAISDLTAAMVEKGRIYEAENKRAEARKLYKETMDFAPENFDLLKYCGMNEIALDSVECGVEFLEKALEIKDDDIETFFALGEGYEKLKNFEEAVETYERAVEVSNGETGARLKLANAYLLKKEPVRSLEITNALLKENGEDRRAMFLKSKLNDYFGNTEAAEDGLGELLALDRENIEYKRQLDEITLRRLKSARELSLSGKFEEAYVHYERILKHQPRHIEALMGKAYVRSTRSDFDGAIEIYRRVLSLEPGNVEAELDIALNLSWKKEYFSAIDEYRKILKKYPKNVSAIVGMARTWSWAGKLDEAVRHYRLALEKEPKNEEGLIGYANALHWCGLDLSAVRVIKTLREIQGKQIETDELEKQIKRDHLRDVFGSVERSWDSDRNTLTAKGTEFHADIDLSARLRVLHKLFETWTAGMENLSKTELTSLNVSKILSENLRIFGAANFYGFEDRNKIFDSNIAGTLGAVFKKFNRYVIYLAADKSIIFDTPQLVSNKISTATGSLDLEYYFSGRAKALASLAVSDYSDKNKKKYSALTFDYLALDRELCRLFSGPAYKDTAFSERRFNGYFSPTDYVTLGAFYRVEFKNRAKNLYLTWRDEYGRQKIELQQAERYRNYNAMLAYLLNDVSKIEAAYTHGSTIGAAAATTGGYAFDYYSLKGNYRF